MATNQFGVVPGANQNDQLMQTFLMHLLSRMTPSPPRDNPEDMFTPEQNLARNQGWANAGPYVTQLSPDEEMQFQQWMAKNGIHPDEATPTSGYDMRGFWQALQQGDPRAVTAVDPNDKKLHYTDTWKTPYGATFSAESMYAKPKSGAPDWTKTGDYVLPDGHVIFSSAIGKWYGMPKSR